MTSLVALTSCTANHPAPHTSIPTEQPKEEVGKPAEQEPRVKQKPTQIWL